jgi:CBS domain-containing protein
VLADQILARKGRDVATIGPDATVTEALAELARRNVGALVVTADGATVDGILSERDVVRRLAVDGAAVLDRPVADVMVTEVTTCPGTTTTPELMALMTDRRVRHVPVLADGRLAGIVSIGDVVKTRVDELEAEAHQLADYISTGR